MDVARPFMWAILSLMIIHGHSTSIESVLWKGTLSNAQMFEFGPDAGDERILAADLPVDRNTHGTPMFGTGVPFNMVKVYMDGHAELSNDERNASIIPIIAPYHLLYSEVTEGHVWYRETQDQDSLDQVKDEIKQAFPSNGLSVAPESMIVITWQFQNITTNHPECVNNQDPDRHHYESDNEYGAAVKRHDLCNCLFNNSHWSTWWSNPVDRTRGCVYCYYIDKCFSRIAGHIANWEYSECWSSVHFPGYYHHHSHMQHCYCRARGYSESVGRCAGHVISYMAWNWGPLSNDDRCRFCAACKPLRWWGHPTYDWMKCHCNTIDQYRDMGKMECLLMFVGAGTCSETLGSEYNLPCTIFDECKSAEVKPAGCDCIASDTQLTEPKLMGCLLRHGYNETIWLCDEDDLDLDYCTCIQDRLPGDVNDEIYCKCHTYSEGDGGDLCQCLSYYGYNGSLPDCGRNRQTAGCQTHVGGKAQPMEENLNTFQAVIVYNEWQTFVYFTYKKLWYADLHVVTRLGYRKESSSAFVGHTSPYLAGNVDDVNLMWKSNMGVDGRWLYGVKGGILQPQ